MVGLPHPTFKNDITCMPTITVFRDDVEYIVGAINFKIIVSVDQTMARNGEIKRINSELFLPFYIPI